MEGRKPLQLSLLVLALQVLIAVLAPVVWRQTLLQCSCECPCLTTSDAAPRAETRRPVPSQFVSPSSANTAYASPVNESRQLFWLLTTPRPSPARMAGGRRAVRTVLQLVQDFLRGELAEHGTSPKQEDNGSPYPYPSGDRSVLRRSVDLEEHWRSRRRRTAEEADRPGIINPKCFSDLHYLNNSQLRRYWRRREDRKLSNFDLSLLKNLKFLIADKNGNCSGLLPEECLGLCNTTRRACYQCIRHAYLFPLSNFVGALMTTGFGRIVRDEVNDIVKDEVNDAVTKLKKNLPERTCECPVAITPAASTVEGKVERAHYTAHPLLYNRLALVCQGHSGSGDRICRIPFGPGLKSDKFSYQRYGVKITSSGNYSFDITAYVRLKQSNGCPQAIEAAIQVESQGNSFVAGNGFKAGSRKVSHNDSVLRMNRIQYIHGPTVLDVELVILLVEGSVHGLDDCVLLDGLHSKLGVTFVNA